MEYDCQLAAALSEGEIISVNGLEVECKRTPDCEVDSLDPREQVRQARERATPRPTSIQEERERTGGFNYNLNRREIWTKYLRIPTSFGEVGVWCYYPRHMGHHRPGLVYAHGGAFLGGVVYTVENPCRLIAERGDCVVWNVDYSLAPEHPYPIPCTQIYDVARYFHDHAQEYDVDSNNIVVCGDSAGGNLAAAAAKMDRDKGTGCIAGQALLYPKLIFDNQGLPDYRRDESAFSIVQEQRALLPGLIFIGSDQANRHDEEVYVQGKYNCCLPYISPACGEAAGMCATLLLLAEYDGLRLEGEYYGKKLQDAGVPVRVVRYYGMAHGFFDSLGIFPQSESAVTEIAAFLNHEKGAPYYA